MQVFLSKPLLILHLYKRNKMARKSRNWIELFLAHPSFWCSQPTQFCIIWLSSMQFSVFILSLSLSHPKFTGLETVQTVVHRLIHLYDLRLWYYKWLAINKNTIDQFHSPLNNDSEKWIPKNVFGWADI